MSMRVWVGRPSGPSRRVGRVLTKAVVLPQTMQSPSHYSAVFQREAAQVIRELARLARLRGRRRRQKIKKRNTMYAALALGRVHVT
jgi:hypothetical protein